MSDIRHYWIYEHDEEGNFVEEDFRDDLKDAIRLAGIYIIQRDWNPRHSVHIVDQIDRDSETIWVAGACTLEGEGR